MLHLHVGFSTGQSRTVSKKSQTTGFGTLAPSVGSDRRASTSIIRSSLLGRSTSLICLTATASPVPQLKAL